MTVLEGNARQARLRVGLNDWLAAFGWSTLGAAGLWIALVIVDDLRNLDLPRAGSAAVLAGLALVVATIRAWWMRRDLLTAAAILDQAAGLQERVSSGLYCAHQDDPFAQAAVADAARVCSQIDVRAHIRLMWPPSLSLAGAGLALALIIHWLPIPALLARTPLPLPQDQGELAHGEASKVQRRLDALREQAEQSPALGELKTQLQAMKDFDAEQLSEPEQIRREGVKKIDQFSDALSHQLAKNEQQMQELQRMFRSLGGAPEPRTPAEQLSQALARSDFKAAEQSVQQMREQLARLEQRADEEQLREMRQQLENLAGKLQQAADQQDSKNQLQEQLQKSGLDQATAQRLLKDLTKKDIEQIEKLLKSQGVSDKQIKDLARQCNACRQAGQQGAGLAQAVQKAAQAMQGGSAASDAAGQLQELSDQLGSMEALGQQLGELQSMLADAQQSKNDLSSEGRCSQCGGAGCSACGGTGNQGGSGGMGQLGSGRGGRAPLEQTPVSFQKVRSPVQTTPGGIISKMFVDGEQVRGDVSTEVLDVVTAAEREATDAIAKDKIPNMYRGPIKEYFSEMRGEFGIPPGGAEQETKDGKDAKDMDDPGPNE